MPTTRFDVIIIGAGPAGVAAAGALAGSGISVALIEAGAYAGAENWSGCVYFTESLAEPDCFGPAVVQNAPFERQVVRRGTLLQNGLDDVGVSLTDPAAFRHCCTVLRPVYDPYFAEAAQRKGAVLLTNTTVTALVRKAGRVSGVSTDRGILSGGVVFLAEGDASHLVRSERLERRQEPHFLQGVKAVLSLDPTEIEQRFGLERGEGAAYEILLRNGAIAGRTARLNAGGFLYTNRDSLSVGYVLPLENLKRHYRGDHGQLLEWMRSLPHLRDLLQGAQLSAYGAKIIRSGGWRERPVLVEDGLAVGGAATGLGIDIPFPNFTGPAAASGLFFGRAVRSLLAEGRSLDRKNLTRAYLDPLVMSVYGRNARHLSRWPGYFGRSRVLFGRTADMACGTARFLATSGLVQTGRFLRSHLLTPRGVRELVLDNMAALSSLRLWRPLLRSLLHPGTLLSWTMNQFRRAPAPDDRLKLELHLEGRPFDLARLPGPLGRLLARVRPGLARAVALAYANDGVPLEKKFSAALRILLRSLRLSDLVVLPAYGLLLGLIGAATAVWDAIRYYVLRTPAATLLAEPVMAYGEKLRKARALEAAAAPAAIEAKLATNTYQVGGASHIRTAWPRDPAKHGEMASAGLWWVCPARVYTYDPPLFGRGAVGVSWENCIKCESCWRAEPSFALWGRQTDHRLVYRPRTAAVPLLLEWRKQAAGVDPAPMPLGTDEQLLYLGPALRTAAERVLKASAAFRDSAESLPRSADRTRLAWPLSLGERLCSRIRELEQRLFADSRHDAAAEAAAERKALEERIAEGSIVRSLYCARRLEQRLRLWMPELPVNNEPAAGPSVAEDLQKEAAELFPHRVVKAWEEEPLPEEWAERLREFIQEHDHPARPAIRALAAVSPALGLIAAGQVHARRLLRKAGDSTFEGFCAVDGSSLEITERGNGTLLQGVLSLVPTAAAKGLLVIARGKGYPVPLDAPGVTVAATPAIGMRAAGLSEVTLRCEVTAARTITLENGLPQDPAAYLAVALGAGDYLARRSREHAASRVQFPGQMLDTNGRDGIAKLGAVKALVSRVEAWRLLLETVSDARAGLPHSALRTPNPALDALCAAAAAAAFGPENGRMAYDAGQVFGGFAYSEDDLLSRAYRDSALFRFLSPGYGAAARLQASVSGKPLAGLLLPELGRLPEYKDPPLAGLVERWKRAALRAEAVPRSADPLLSGEAAAVLLGSRSLLSRLEQELEQGRSIEAEAACAEVLIKLAESAAAAAELSAGSGRVPPDALFPMEPAGSMVKLERDYAAFCDRPGPAHRSGAFLLSVFDRSEQYLPEMQLHDPGLRELWAGLVDWFRKHCTEQDGLPFERSVEKAHDLPPELVAGIRKNRWLATYIPAAEDGLGWRKAQYYVLNSAAGSFGDAGICLLIMASTSIGATPVLLGLEDELPRVREELEPLAKDEKRLGEISRRVKRIVASFRAPNPGRVRKEYQAVMALVDSRIRRTRVVKYLAASFLKAFYGAGLAGRRGDFGGFMTGLTKAAELVDRIMPDVRGALEELPRRERCHRLFLRGLGHGGVSAFALTEPTAGSDSGGVKTTASLRTAFLTPLPDGRYAFSPTGDFEKCRRYLIDADRIEFTEEGMAYRTPDNGLAAVRYDRVPDGPRYYEHQGASCEFHDIGQVRETDKGKVYEYYSLTGAKMWITNGSIATQFSLYAQSPEGVTAFMVDRYAEGLTVGADERKMGQRGSPTNEISLDSVRVAREAVIGYEGHGQVNALETLNAGRCGLAVVAGALGRKVLDEARRAAPPSAERDRLLGEAAAVLFGSESLAYYLTGLFDRPHESVRMESAIAKYACAEDIHEILTLAERVLGPAGQTERHLLEKARRDSRILNIYEGTNEVQRFLILKDLIAMAADWPGLPERIPERPDDERAMTLSRWKNRIRGHARAAAELLGDAAWADAMLQPALFLLADLAGEVLRLECVWRRLEWLVARRELLGAEYVEKLGAAGERAAERALGRLAHLDERYQQAWELLRNGRSLPEVVAADALLDRAERHAAAARPAAHAGAGPLRILSILRPAADLPPDPRLDRGSLRELLWTIGGSDRAALDQALALKAADGGATVHAFLAGGKEHEGLLRSAAAGADRLFRLDLEHPGPKAIAAAVSKLEKDGAYDLLLCGGTAGDGSEGLPAFLAGYLQRELAAADASLAGERRPLIAGIAASGREQARDLTSLLAAYEQEIAVITGMPGTQEAPVYSRPGAAAGTAKTVTTVAGAAELLSDFAAAERAAAAEPFTGGVRSGVLPKGPAAWALVSDQSGRTNPQVLRAARTAAGQLGITASALVIAPRDAWPLLLGLARTSGIASAFCFDTGDRILSEKGRESLLQQITRTTGEALLFGGPDWNSAFSRAAGRAAAEERTIPFAAGCIALAADPDGSLLFDLPAYGGSLVRKLRVKGSAAFVTLGPAAVLPEQAAARTVAAAELELGLGPDATVPRPPGALPSLSTADVIIDLGYGVKDRTGMELAQELKAALEGMGLAPLFGATRKVTQDLKLLPLEAQIGQTGVRVNPRLIIALGISGAPQHLDWIGGRAEILCFNKDPGAPLMKLNATRPAPRVHPVEGDLFATVRELLEKLKNGKNR